MSQWHSLWPRNNPTYISWSSDFVIYIEDYFIYEGHTWDIGSVLRKDWPHKIPVDHWPIFHGLGILLNIFKIIWWMTIIYWNDLRMHRIPLVLFSAKIFILWQYTFCFIFQSTFALNQYQWFEWKSKSALPFWERGITLHYQTCWFCIYKRIGFSAAPPGRFAWF